jgi:ribonuclease VapC
MSLNIKNPEVHELAKELAELTGESMTEAVLVALKERLARERNTEERLQERMAVLTAIGRDVAERLGPEWRAIDITHARIRIEPVDEAQAVVARQAFRDYGKGSGHPAKLNFGDCFSYALASVTGQPLLFKGDDFGHTDITSAV